MDDHDRLVDLNVTDDRARAAYRRRRALTAGLGAVAVLAVIGAGGLVVQSMRTTGGPQPANTAAAPPTAPRSTGAVGISLGPTTPPGTTPAVVPTQPAPTTAQTPPPPVWPLPTPAPGELKVSGPTTVTLQSDGTIYRGQFTVTITNAGPPYNLTQVLVFLPTGVHVDTAAGNPGFSMCGTTSLPDWWGCSGPSIPSGGTVTNTVHLTADYAPLSTPITITRFTLLYNQAGDLTPDDNVVAVTIQLPAAA